MRANAAHVFLVQLHLQRHFCIKPGERQGCGVPFGSAHDSGLCGTGHARDRGLDAVPMVTALRRLVADNRTIEQSHCRRQDHDPARNSHKRHRLHGAFHCSCERNSGRAAKRRPPRAANLCRRVVERRIPDFGADVAARWERAVLFAAPGRLSRCPPVGRPPSHIAMRTKDAPRLLIRPLRWSSSHRRRRSTKRLRRRPWRACARAECSSAAPSRKSRRGHPAG